MNRRLLAAVALVVVLGTAGCTGIFGSDPGTAEEFSQEADYEFDTDRDAFVVVSRDNYTAVYNVSAKRTGDNGTIELFRTNRLSVERPLELRGLQFRYPNGTRVRYVDGEPARVYPNGTTEPTDALAVNSTRQRAVVELPAEEGQLAFTTPRHGKRITIHSPVEGNYTVALPPNTDAAIPLLSQVRPSNDGRTSVGDRVYLTFEGVEASVLVVRWYLDRDLRLFGGLAVLGVVAGIAGAGYYYVQIQRAKQRRESEGIDIDFEDDRDEPPPGMG